MGGLSNAMQNTVADIKFSTDNRRVSISEMRSETGNMIKRFQLDHLDMAKEQQEKLSSEEAARVKDTRTDIQNIRKALEEKFSSGHALRMEAQEQLEEKFSSEHALRMEAQEQFVSNTRDFRTKLSSETPARVKDTRQFLDAIASDCRKAHELWMSISVDTVEEEAVSQPAVEVEVEVEEETVAEEKEETAGKEEESLPPPIAEEVEPSLEARILETVTKHSEGIKLVDIGNELGVDWRGLIGGIKSLVDEDKVEKIDNLYYPKS